MERVTIYTARSEVKRSIIGSSSCYAIHCKRYTISTLDNMCMQQKCTTLLCVLTKGQSQSTQFE